MKILHTADIHLKEYGDERWDALIYLIEFGKREEIDLFIICGDLFDREIDADNLRPKIRAIFSNNPFRIVILPGNHDYAAFESGIYFGSDTVIVSDINTPFEYGDSCIWGFPFKPLKGEEILQMLLTVSSRLAVDRKNILLYHGELLDAYYSRQDFGSEGDERYMPVKLSYFGELNFDYILAGHFHTHFDVRTLGNGGHFVYPGSPVSVTKREIGRRKVNLFEVGDGPGETVIDTPYYEEIILELDPFEDKTPLDVLKDRIAQVPTLARLIVSIGGYFNGKNHGCSETELARQIEKLMEKRNAEITMEFRDIQHILEDELFTLFLSKLDRNDYQEERKKQLREIAVRAMAGAQI